MYIHLIYQCPDSHQTCDLQSLLPVEVEQKKISNEDSTEENIAQNMCFTWCVYLCSCVSLYSAFDASRKSRYVIFKTVNSVRQLGAPHTPRAASHCVNTFCASTRCINSVHQLGASTRCVNSVHQLDASTRRANTFRASCRCINLVHAQALCKLLFVGS